MKRFNVTVNNRGFSLLSDRDEAKRSFVPVPFVSAYTPSKGSTNGGFTLSITGGGFTTSTTVEIGAGTTCAVDSATPITYDTIVCTAPANPKAAELIVMVGNLKANCSNSSLSCTIGHSALDTPQVTTISPSQISGTGATMTISGRAFGKKNRSHILL